MVLDPGAAAERWRETWERAWPASDVAAIAALYADDAVYRSHPFRPADRGVVGVRRYLESTFGEEVGTECRFGRPVVSGDRAAIEWWGSWVEHGKSVTLAGVTVLRFNGQGLVVDHRDYWNDVDRREPPYRSWDAGTS